MNAPADTQLDIADHPAIWRWLKEKARRDPEAFLYLTRGNVRSFTAFYGRAHWRIKGDPTWTHGWSFSEEGLNWIVLSGPTSTGYRLRPSGDDFLTDTRVGLGGVAFLDRLLTRLTRLT